MKYFIGLLAIALLSHSASAQLRCIKCENCETIPTPRPIDTCTFPTTPAPPPTTIEPGTTTLAVDTAPPPTIESTDPTVPPPVVLDPVTEPSPPVPENRPDPPPFPTLPPPNTLTPPTVAQLDNENVDELPPNARKRRNADTESFVSPIFSCFEIRVPVGTGTQVHRGCVENGGSTNQTCWRANNNAAAPQDCRICSGQECNSATGLISSIFLTITAVFILLKIN